MRTLAKLQILIFTLLTTLLPFQKSMALSLNPQTWAEGHLMKVIDEEFLRMSEDPENLEWTEDHGLQPTDGYELDYAEKCAFIASSPNKSALAACAVVLATN